MKETTLCYVTRGQEVLLLHRIKKQQDVNQGKWIGIGGKLEAGESPEQCLLREVREETGLQLTSWRKRGIVDFYSDCADDERMHLYTADGFTGTLGDCDEGVLAWVPQNEMLSLPTWEGDHIFLELLARGERDFHLALHYRGDQLLRAELNGKPL